MVEELLERTETLEEKKDELNHRRNQLDQEHRDSEELVNYHVGLSDTIDRLYDEDKEADPVHLLSNVTKYSEIVDGFRDLDLSRDGFANEVIERIPNKKEDYIESIEEGGEELNRLIDLAETLYEMGEGIIVNGYNDSETVSEIFDQDYFDESINESMANYFDELISTLEQPLKIYNTASFEILMQMDRYNEEEAREIAQKHCQGEGGYEDKLSEVEDVIAPEEPTELMVNLLEGFMQEYEEKIQRYEELEKEDKTSKNPEKSPSLPEIEEHVEYDFEVFDEDFSKKERRVIKDIAGLSQDSSVSRRDLENAFNWAWTDTANQEQPDLDKDERSRLKELKKDFEKYLNESQPESGLPVRDKPDLESLRAAGLQLEKKGKRKKIVER